MITFDALDIPGTHEAPIASAPLNHSIRTKFASVNGESEIRLGRGGRLITCRIIIHGGYQSYNALDQKLSELDQAVNRNGDLNFTPGPFGGLQRTYQACTFQGFEKDPENTGGPLPDNIGLLDGTKPSWWVHGTLTWYQLSTDPQSDNS